MNACADDSVKFEDCSYCKPQTGLVTNLFYYQTAFTTTKLRSDDFEHLLERGFTRCGTMMYIRNNIKSCCEVYPYKVDVDNFVLSKS